MNIVADQDMPGLELFTRLGHLTRLPGRAICAADLAGADILLVRSITRVDQDLLADSQVRFVGSATIGTDHLDLPWLAGQGIRVAHAPGCNAVAVAEYVLQLALSWLVETDREPADCRVGVLGLGNVGARVSGLLAALGFDVLGCDPPARASGRTFPTPMGSLDEILACDLISLHVPLIREGRWPTWHLLDAERLAGLGEGQLLINTCRGPVIDNSALLQHLADTAEPGRRGAPEAMKVALDVWENEPDIDRRLFERVWRGTPHIAGHSREGKMRGTWMIYRECCDWLDRPAQPMPQLAPERQVTEALNDWRDLLRLLVTACPLVEDHRLLGRVLGEKGPGAGFDHLRRDYRERHELAGMQALGPVAEDLKPALVLLGVRLP